MAEQETRRPFSKSDALRLFELLERLYQGRKAQRDNVSVAVWREVLKLWSYETVRDAVIRRSRENRFFPDPSEVAEYCGPHEFDADGRSEADRIRGDRERLERSARDDLERMYRIVTEMGAEEKKRWVTVTVEMTFIEDEEKCTKERMEQRLRGWGRAEAVRVIDLTTEEVEADGQDERPLQDAVLHGV